MPLKPMRGLTNGFAFIVLIVGGIAAGVALQCADVVVLLATRLPMHRRTR